MRSLAGEYDFLLRDARLLARHAVENGKLPAESRVIALLSNVREGKHEWTPETVAAFYGEVDLLAKAIAPTTLNQLGVPGSVAALTRRVAVALTPFILGFLTLLLTIYLAFQSSQLSQADTALREYQDWDTQHPREKLYTAWKMFHYERVLNVDQPPFAQLDAYQKLVEDARQLAEKFNAIRIILEDASRVVYVPRTFESNGPAWVQRLARQANGVPPPSPPGNYDNLKKADDTTVDCKELPKGTEKARSTKVKVAEVDINTYATQYRCFLQHLQIDADQVSYSPWVIIYPTKSKIALLTIWFLPGLYGLLGSCVYVMRELILFRSRPVTRDPSVLNLLSLSLRIALGGLAGIIIGWFWLPSGGNGAAAMQPISSIPFGIAFFAGFSIETLFSLLDRIKASIAGGGKAPPTETASGAVGTAKTG